MVLVGDGGAEMNGRRRRDSNGDETAAQVEILLRILLIDEMKSKGCDSRQSKEAYIHTVNQFLAVRFT